MPETSLENLQEIIKEKAEENKWSLRIALSTALIAMISAFTGLLAENYSEKGLIFQIKASDQWAFYQARGVKSEILYLQKDSEEKQILSEKYKHDQLTIKSSAHKFEKDSEINLEKSSKLSQAVTLFQIAIALSAISTLTKRTFLWFASIGISFIGIILLIVGVL